jgi:hypothetical protein
LVAFAALYAAPLQATTIAFDFNSLPSAQGWTLNTSGPSEASAYSVDGTKLTINTIGSGTTYSWFSMPFPFDPTKPFTIEARARVTAAETTSPGADATGLVFVASTLGESFGVMMNSTDWRPYDGTLVLHPIDATVFHTFRIEATPGVGQDIFIDDVLVYSGPVGPYGVDPPILAFGDGSSFENIAAEITKLEFRQVLEVPEPHALLTMLTALAGLALAKRRRMSHLLR